MKYVANCRWASPVLRSVLTCRWLPHFTWAALIWISLPLTGFAAAPPHDLCSSAEIIPSNGPFPHLTALVEDITTASTNGDPVVPICVTNVNHSLWYQFSPASNATYTFSVGTDSTLHGTTLQDTVMAVYESGSSDCAGPLTELTCRDDEAGLLAAVRVALTTNRTYFIGVWTGLLQPTPPNVAVRMLVSIAEPPPNDLCSGAIDIPGNELPYLTPLVDTTLATSTNDPAPPGCAVNGGIRAVWYRFIPATTAGYLFSTREPTNTTILDTLIGLYAATNGCGGPLTPVACDDNGGGRAALGARLNAGSTYYIVVWEGGNEEVTLSETTLQLRVEVAPLPEVTTLAATNITSSSAFLGAEVNPKGLPTAVWFQWGTTTNSYGRSTSARNAGSGINPAVLTRLVTSFDPDVTYHFRAVATNAGGLVYGADRTFRFSTSASIADPMRQANGNFTADFDGSPGQVYQILGSTNLTTWEVIGPATYLGGDRFRFTDPGAASRPYRFYRVTSP